MSEFFASQGHRVLLLVRLSHRVDHRVTAASSRAIPGLPDLLVSSYPAPYLSSGFESASNKHSVAGLKANPRDQYATTEAIPLLV